MSAYECTCAMSESSMVNCEVHGYDSNEEILADFERRQEEVIE